MRQSVPGGTKRHSLLNSVGFAVALALFFSAGETGALAQTKQQLNPFPVTQSRAFDRVIPDNRFWPWSAIGRLNQSGYRQRRHCTAVLVSPKKALTAAHCLEGNIQSGQHFLPGYRGGGFLEHRPVTGSKIYDAWKDLALVSFEDPSGEDPLTFARELKVGDEVVLAGYNGQDRQRLSLGRGCQVIAIELDTQNLLHNCRAGQGDSGAPVLKVIRRKDGQLDYRLAAIHFGVIDAPQEIDKHGLGVANNVVAFQHLR